MQALSSQGSWKLKIHLKKKKKDVGAVSHVLGYFSVKITFKLVKD